MIRVKGSPQRLPVAPRVGPALGASSKVQRTAKLSEADRTRFESVSAMLQTGLGPNVGMSSNPVTIDLDPMMTGLAPTDELSNALIPVYRDIYYNEPISGSTVDLMSQLPFSEFSLGGVADPRVLAKYTEAVERLGVRTLLPEASVDHLVTGKFTGSLLYNSETQTFVDLMTHAAEHVQVSTLPLYTQDPILDVTFPADVKAIVSRPGKRLDRLREMVGSRVIDAIKSGRLELEPLNTIYVPRKTFTQTDQGMSYLRRILPIYLIEKNLYRGTLVESARRQRGILHLTLGDGETWIPTPDDMNFMTGLFMDADCDPMGAVIATQQGVEASELRQGGDFWKVTDFTDTVLNHKLRALGVSEAFLSGDVSLATSENGLMVFLDMLRTYRESWTRKFFYDKLFPLVSMVNGFAVNSSGKLIRKENMLDSMTYEEAMYRMNDGSRLLRPTVNWSKQLKNVGDQQMVDLLDGMSQKGFPVPLRMMAAAGGLDMDELTRQKDEDLKIRKSMQEYLDAIKALAPAPSGEEDEEMSESSTLAALSSVIPGPSRSSVQRAGGTRIPLLDRDFQGQGEIIEKTRTGRPKAVLRQAQAQKRANERILKSFRRIKKAL